MQLDPQEFLVAFLPGETRTLTRTGVEIHCLQYWADPLAPWVGQRRSVTVHYDPRDITHVYVRCPGGPLVRCGLTTPNVPAISLSEWHMRREQERVIARDPALVATQDESLKRADQLVQQAKATRRVKRRVATAAAGDAFRATPIPTMAPEPAFASIDDASNEAISITHIYEVGTYDQF